jgi:hypothetical protein
MAESAPVLGVTRRQAPAARPSEPTFQPPPPTLIFLAAAVTCSGAFLLILQSHLTFFADEWMFLLDRRGFSTDVFLDPHNEHIAIVPVAIYKALLALFGMDSALPFAIVSTLVFLLSAVFLFVYLRRRAGDWSALLGSVMILFLGAAWTDLLWPFQIGFSGSIAAGIGALLALDRDDRKGDLVACALLVLATSFSELGIPFAAGAFISVVLRPSRRRSGLYVALVPVALYGIWYLGWGHTGPQSASFDNLVDSPRFIFDSISENLVSLLGLATPFSEVSSPNLDGLNWGRALLLIAIGLAIWRLWRVGRPSRWLWAAVAAGGTFWFLTALNAIPLLRTPTSSRYQYPGAVFVLLIAAELLRGVRLGRRVLVAATAVTVAAAISGAIFLHDGYESKREASENLRARLAAVEIGRGHTRRDAVILFHLFIPRPARSYLSAADAFGSPALSEAQLAASDEEDRGAADQQLAGTEGIRLGPLAPADRATRSSGRCNATSGSSASAAGLALGPGDYALRVGKLSAADQVGPLQAARFADAPTVNLGLLQSRSSAVLSIPPDGSKRPWRLYSPPARGVAVCRLGPA